MDKYKLPFWIKVLITFGILCIISIILVYIFHFGGVNNFGDQEKFGLLGDYVGGLINPILTFLTVVLLIWSIRIQIGELDATREELQETRNVHQQQLSLNKREIIRKQFYDDANMYIKNCEELLDKPVFLIRTILDEHYFVSVNDTFKNSKFYGNDDVESKLKKFPKILESDQGAETLHLHRIRTQLGFAVSSVCHLFQYLEVDILRHSWESRVCTLIVDCKSVGIITDDEEKDFNLSLLGAEVVKLQNQ